MGEHAAPGQISSASLTAILAALVLIFGVSIAHASRKGIASDSNAGDWVYVDHDLSGTRYSHLKQITTKNVAQLIKACAYSFPGSARGS